MPLIYNNPTVDAMGAVGQGAGALGENIVRLAMMRRVDAQRQQDMMMEVQRMRAQQDFQNRELSMRGDEVKESRAFRQKQEADTVQGRKDVIEERTRHDKEDEKSRHDEVNRQKTRDALMMHQRYKEMAQRAVNARQPRPAPEVNPNEILTLLSHLSGSSDAGVTDQVNPLLAQLIPLLGPRLIQLLSGTNAPAQGQPQPQAQSNAVPPPQARPKGFRTQTAKGTFEWDGQGWIPAK